MSNLSKSDDPFADVFADAEATPNFWISKAKFAFTEDMLREMKKTNTSKSDLAKKLGVRAAQISRLCSGRNNFTMETMVRVARALNCEFITHLQPAGVTVHWMHILSAPPAAASPAVVAEFTPIAFTELQAEISNECATA